MNEATWMEKGPGHVNDGDLGMTNTARIGTKRSHQWFVDSADSGLSPDKKQVLQTVNTKLSSRISYTSVPPWENTPSLQSVPNPFVDRLIGSEAARSVKFSERNISAVGTDNLSGRKGTDSYFGDDVPFGLSVDHGGPETCLSYAGIRKVKVNQVKDCDNGIHALRRHDSNNSDLSTDHAFSRENETNFVSMGQSFNKEHDSIMLLGHTYNTSDTHIRSAVSNYGRVDDNTISISDTYSKGDTSIISFSGFPDEQDIIPVGRPIDSYDQLYHQTSMISEAPCEKEPDPINVTAVINTKEVVKPRSDLVSKNKSDKTPKKEAPNSFPSNVRSLISTGMLDGVPVKYVSLAREELRGIIKGSGYLCGCQSCNYSKVLNAYEFERHAGSKTKHPNNHIYFDNGKTIYQIVQELRSTPASLLFDTIQTVFGAPINQKSFRVWKESFQAATRELQRIYGKEELNL